jgi:protein phosphatase
MTTRLILHAATATDLGLIRENNEDVGYAGRHLIAVADGIGGMPAGELASAIAIDALAELEEAPPADPVAALVAAVRAGNDAIRVAGEADPTREGMGTTVTALLLSGDQQLGLVHVGDSRAYRLRDRSLTQLTRDDTFVQSLVEQGFLAADEVRSHPQRSLVTRAVQGEPVKPAGSLLEPEPGDRYLLCSDGLSDVVLEEAIATALSTFAEPAECAGQLIKLALQAGAPDNITVVVADLVNED